MQLTTIDVRPPYFALDGVELAQPGSAYARVRPEHPLGHEDGPLAAAEAGRHLAILGTCACRSVSELAAPHYYLAKRARLVHHVDHGPVYAPHFVASAQAVEPLQRRDARAHAVLRAAESGALMYELDVTYKVLSQPAFERLFSAHRRDMRAQPRQEQTTELDADQLLALRGNPYQRPLPLEITRRTPESVRARLRSVTADLCAGHFPLYPSLPVAMLMQGLSALCGEALRGRWGNLARYRVIAADISAERLAFVGERLFFEAAFQQARGDKELYQAWAALEDGTTVGWLAIELEPLRWDTRDARATPAFI